MNQLDHRNELRYYTELYGCGDGNDVKGITSKVQSHSTLSVFERNL